MARLIPSCRKTHAFEHLQDAEQWPDDLQIASQNREGFEYVWFTNPLPLASIPTVRETVLCKHLPLLSLSSCSAGMLRATSLQAALLHLDGRGSICVALQVWHSHVISRPLRNGQKGRGVHVGVSKGL